jgi:hypothetical protein
MIFCRCTLSQQPNVSRSCYIHLWCHGSGHAFSWKKLESVLLLDPFLQYMCDEFWDSVSVLHALSFMFPLSS